MVRNDVIITILVRLRVLTTLVVSKKSMSVWLCAVSISRVCVVCYSTHHHVMSQARDDFEGFLKAHMTEQEKVIVHI